MTDAAATGPGSTPGVGEVQVFLAYGGGRQLRTMIEAEAEGDRA